MASKVANWVECDLRYVGETKLARLDDEELVKLHHLLVKKHALPHVPLSGNREANIAAVMTLKAQIAKKKAPPEEPEAPAQLDAPIVPSPTANEPPHEEHDAQKPGPEEKDELTAAAKAFDVMFSEAERAAPTGEPVASAEATSPPEVLSEEAERAKEDREARISAFVQLAAAASPPTPTGDDDAKTAMEAEAVTVDDHHRLRICSFNACKMRLGSANKAYIEAGDDGTCDEYEGTHKGAELAKKWLTLASRMADFDVILLQEVPGTEKVMDQKIETFASMLEIATEEGRYWSAINSQKSGKDGKVVGPGAEVHVCFIKSPVQFKAWNTLRKVGATELDYAPLQVVLHDERFADPADRDFVVTSVHLPPSKRVDARDSQIAALLRNYSAPDTSEYRMQLPFKPNKETKVSPTHVLAGDYNTFPGNAQYNMLGSGFVSKIPQDAATTSGHQNYDNILVDTRANERLLIGGGIMQLKDPHNAAKGEVGLSDHYPVFVEICEVQKTRKAGPLPEPCTEVLICEECTLDDTEEPAPPPPLGLQPVAEEEPQPPLAEVPMAIWDRLSEEAKPSNPNYNLDQTKPEFTDDSEEDSDFLTDDDGLPRVVHDEEPPSEEVVREVVDQTMERIMKGVLEKAAATTPTEAPAATVTATEAPPLPPAPPPVPAPDTAATAPPAMAPEQAEEEWKAAWNEAIAGPFPQCASPVEAAALPEGLTTLASETDSEPESAPESAPPAQEEVAPPLVEVD